LPSSAQSILSRQPERHPPTIFTDTGVTPGGSYFYKVKAIDTSGTESEFSAVTATTVYQLTPYQMVTKGTLPPAPVKAVVGDFNGDGKPDLAVLNRGASGGKNSGGAIDIYFGGSSRTTVGITLSGFGQSLVVADLNKDGFDDLIVADHLYDPYSNSGYVAGTAPDGGRVQVFAGASLMSKAPVLTIDGTFSYANNGSSYYILVSENLGFSLAAAGDLNGDGYPDIAIGVPYGGDTRSGSVHVLYGGPVIQDLQAKRNSSIPSQMMGYSVTAAGDQNGDGIADLLIGAPMEQGSYPARPSQAYLLYGGMVPQLVLKENLQGGAPGYFTDTIPTQLTAATDFDGDGITDLIVGGSTALNIYKGGVSSIQNPYVIISPGAQSIATPGDINHDGHGDILANNRLYFGHSGLARNPYITTASSYQLVGTGDVNGDGFPEAILTNNTTIFLASLDVFQGLPKITITSGIDNSITTTSNISITGTVTGAPTLLLVGGKDTPVAGDGSFSANVSLQNGKNFVEVIAKGSDGRMIKRYLAVSAVTTPLEVTITSPASGATLTTNPVTVQGTVSEATSQVLVNGSVATVSGTSWSAVITLANGQQTIIATATDSYSRSTSTSITVTFNNQPPSGTILGAVTDGNGSPLPNALIKVTDTASVSRNAYSDIQGRYSLLNVPTGSFSALYSKSGYIGKSVLGALSANQVLDLSVQLLPAPALQIAITSPLPGSVFHTPQAVVSGTVNNDASVTVNGVSAQAANGSFSATTMLTLGNGQITATAQDQYEQTANVSIPVVYLPGPLVTEVVAVPVSGSSVKVTWRTDQPATGVVDYGATINYGAQATQPVSTLDHAVTITGLTPGNSYHLRISATNSNGFTTVSDDLTVTLPLFSARFIEDRGAVTVMEIEGNYDANNADGSINAAPRQLIATEYFKNHPDQDFLTFLTTFDYAMPEATAKGYYLTVKNDTHGINQPIFDYTGQYGSNGKLQGTIDMGNVTALAGNVYGPKLDETVTVLNHELMHRFGAYVRYKNPDGTLNTALLGKDSAHWSYLLDSKGSLMYGNGWKANGDGTFTSTSKQSAYSPLDLYLMGMIPKEQVPPMLLIDNPAIDKTLMPHLGDTISGTAKTVTIDDIIAAEGPRIPNAASSQKQFNVGFVLLTRAGDNTTAATAAIETLRKAWAGRFAELTQGKGSVANIPASLEVAVDSPTDGATITGPDVTVSGTVINSSGAETGVTVNGVPATVTGNRFIANHVPLQLGSNTISITATDTNGLATTRTRNVTNQNGHYIRINSSIESGIAPLDISLRLDSSFSIANPTMSFSGPVPITLTPGTSSTEFTTQLAIEGTYTITASAVGPDGQTYTDSVTITVVNRWQLDSQLRAKWENIRTALAAGDVATAVTNFNPLTMEIYREQFTSLSASLPTIAAGMGNIMLVRVEDDQAEYDMHDTVNGTEYSFYLLFVKGGDGLWKIRNF
jgi:Glucodextranase, domain B/FG-GAP repeat/Carboxypeptidase regulatory-like domain/FG-GAP-like repeat